MKSIIQIGLFLILLSNISIAQVIYTGSFDFNRRNEFSLISDYDSITIHLTKKKVDFDKITDNSFSFSKSKRNVYSFIHNNNAIEVIQTKRNLTFDSGLNFFFKKRSSNELILGDNDGKIVLTAEYDFKYPTANYKFFIYDKIHLPELISYATFYLFEKSKELKNAYETPYIFFGIY